MRVLAGISNAGVHVHVSSTVLHRADVSQHKTTKTGMFFNCRVNLKPAVHLYRLLKAFQRLRI